MIKRPIIGQHKRKYFKTVKMVNIRIASSHTPTYIIPCFMVLSNEFQETGPLFLVARAEKAFFV